MQGIILAAGRGSRMGERTAHLPKCLTELAGKTLLERQVESLKGAGVDEITVVVGYKGDEIRKRFPKLNYVVNEDWENTNMVATLLKAEEILKNEDVVISYSDIVYSKTAVELLKNCKEDLAITYYTKFLPLWEKRFENPLEDLETFRINEKSELTEIGNSAKSFEEIEGQYMGLLKFSPSGYEKIKAAMGGDMPKPVEKIDMTGLISYLIGKNVAFKALAYDELWLEVDNGEDLKIYENDEKIKEELRCLNI